MHFSKHFATSLLSAALAAAVPFCLAQGQAGQQHPKQGQAAAHPSRSMASANQRAADLLNTINQTEIESAQSVQGHLDNASVKSFAQDLVNDHQNLQKQLEDAASKANINLKENASMKTETQKETRRMEGEKPAHAASSFVAEQITDHEHAVRRLQRLEPQITDPQLKQVVQSSIPMLEKHLSAARKLRTELKSGHAKGSGGRG